MYRDPHFPVDSGVLEYGDFAVLGSLEAWATVAELMAVKYDTIWYLGKFEESWVMKFQGNSDRFEGTLLKALR